MYPPRHEPEDYLNHLQNVQNSEMIEAIKEVLRNDEKKDYELMVIEIENIIGNEKE